ncbi:Polyadenylate-binding protein 1 [Armadillidium nasatum]|uniref:Polyadenylate-binding protein 1 n=1 Tax=Armadillidium nasatum TaxID=96803 RepID=A0A5N5SSP0_9CRUS|nr:Polyadenylate-binding protein 1 [Armadillidium nasatum]
MESLGYAYVNCLTKLDAERILSAMNYEYLKGKPMRIMWVEDDPSRKSHSSNVIIKNLHKSIDTRVLYDTFSYFGKIVSCKIPTDEQGRSKSYGFIHFETEEEANFTIEKVNGKLILNKKVTVEKYKSRGEMRLKSLEEKGNAEMYNSRKEIKFKSLENKENEFVEVTKNTNLTDVCVKNFNEKMSDDDLYNLFFQIWRDYQS